MSVEADLVGRLHCAMGIPERHAVVDLGGCRVRLRLDQASAVVLDRFDLLLDPSQAAAHFEVSCCVPATVPPDLGPAVRVATARTVRGRNLQRGYYATDNFGAPAEMVSDGRRFVVIAEQPDRVVWSYLVKHLLLRWSMTQDAVFLKGAAVEQAGHAILFVARGGGGKTTMATALASLGWSMLANSHVLVSDGILTGVATSMRVREEDPEAPEGVRERLVRPLSVSDAGGPRPSPLGLVCVLSRNPETSERVQRLDPSSAIALLTSFASGLDVYRLEEDLLDDVGGDYERFARASQRIRTHLLDIVERCPVVLVNHDVLRPGGSEALADVLRDRVRLPA